MSRRSHAALVTPFYLIYLSSLVSKWLPGVAGFPLTLPEGSTGKTKEANRPKKGNQHEVATRMDSDEWEDNPGPSAGLLPLPSTPTSPFFQMIERTTQQYWCWITFKHHLPLSLQTSIQISNLSIRKELQDSGKRGYRWKLHDINTNRIVMLKKKKVKRKDVQRRQGSCIFFLIFASERPFLIKPVGEPNSLPRPNC